MKSFDIIIIGSGLVGILCALHLHRHHYSIAVIEKNDAINDQDPRLIALNHSNIQYLQALNLWSQLQKDATPISKIQLSQQKTFGTALLDAEEFNIPFLGYVIPASILNQVFKQALSTTSVQTFFGETLTEIHQTANDVTISTESQTNFQAKFILGADGTHSAVRQLLSIPTECHDYTQQALVTQTILKRSHNNIAFQRYTPQGTIAMLPLKDDTAATIWTGNNAVIDRLLQQTDEAFLKQLQQTFGYRLGRFLGIKKRYHYPLKYIKAQMLVQGRGILLGNAAFTLHPIAAQGLNLSIQLLQTLMPFFEKALPNPSDLLSANQFDTSQFHFSHQLASMMQLKTPGANHLRSLGLMIFDLIPNLKRQFANHMHIRYHNSFECK